MSDKVKKRRWIKNCGPNVWITFLITATACYLPLFKFGLIDNIVLGDNGFINNVSLLLATWSYIYFILSLFHTKEEIYGDERNPFSWGLAVRQIIMFPIILLPGILWVFVAYYVFMLFMVIIKFTIGLLFLPFW